MDHKKLNSIGLTVFMILLIANPVNSIDTGGLKNGFREINLPIDVSIKLWGFEDINSNLIPFFEGSLPKNIIGESVYPSENKIDQQVMFIRDDFYGIQNKIKYNIEPVNPSDHLNLKSNIPYYYQNNHTRTAIYNTDFGSVTQSGFVVDKQNFSEMLEPYNSENGYTVHLLNLTEINNHVNNTNTKHWYQLGDIFRSAVNQDDISNVGIVGGRGLFYDPSASAPHLDSPYFVNSNIDLLLNTLSSRITDLIENIFVGSPIYSNYNFLQPIVHFDQVVIGLDDVDYDAAESQLGSEYVAESTFYKALNNLFPYFEISSKSKLIKISSRSEGPIINYTLSLEREYSNSTKYVKINNLIAESYKDIIRNNYHENRPAGYYFLSLIFVDSTDRKFIWDTSAGEREYEFGEIGFGILNLADWRNLDDVSKSRVSIKQLGIQNFGKMMGLPLYSNKFASQIMSPMSDYGITEKWDSTYSQFEIDSVARRLGAHYNNSAIHSLNALRANLKGGAFRWIDRSSLDDAELTLRLGNIEYTQGNFTGAVELYIKGYYQWIDAKEELTQLQNAFYNGIELIAIVLVLLYLISTLKLFTLTKEDFISNTK